MDDGHPSSPRAARVVALVLGCLLLLPALAALLGGTVLGLAAAFGRDADGYFEASLDRIESSTVAVTAEEIDLTVDPGTPGWAIDALEADVRLRATSADGDADLFVGIGPEADVDRYLDGVAHDEVRRIERGERAELRTRTGTTEVEPPAGQDFWVASDTGAGTRELVWEATRGRWAVVLMNADASPGVSADVDVGVRADVVVPLAVGLSVVGLLMTAAAVVVIVVGARGLGEPRHARADAHPAPGAAPVDRGSPVTLEAVLEDDLSRWKWLVKWFLAIPHFVVLALLWVAFVVLTVVAGVAILFTGRYPQGIFAFNVGVMRWSWRVSYYAATGGLGTDRYPPFTLLPDEAYPARLDVDEPGEVSRGLVLVKWWLLAIPHYLIVGLFAGGTVWATADDGWVRAVPFAGGGLLGVLVLVAAVILLVRGSYPRSLFELVVGLNRWIFRVVAYAALMTDTYPPFRLDQGGSEPTVDAAVEPVG